MAQAMGFHFIDTLPTALAYVAMIAWTVTFYAFLAELLRSLW